jgi:ketosteroid isomerase-like protein
MAMRDIAFAYYDAVDDGDNERLLAMFHPDVVYRRGGYPVIKGSEALRDFYENVRIIEHGKHHVDSIICDHEEVAVRGRFTGTARDGRPLDIGWADFMTFHGGLIRERVTYFLTPGV